MASIVPGFEYDIFISYRQKDNKGERWVTEFVNALKTDLESTFKEDVSIYFDENPHDGLLESHLVDKSLEGKLKCAIFIPIISQTFCDPKSFAWQHEFCYFNKMAKAHEIGRDIKLLNGNVASRILLVKIHDLDEQDTALLEKELGGFVRAIEFIFRSTGGVNRPLRPNEDHPLDNLNKTFYRDQINKVSRAIKELIFAIQHPEDSPKTLAHQKSRPKSETRKKLSRWAAILVGLGMLGLGYYYFSEPGNRVDPPLNKSIAVLPFVNLSNDVDQEPFSDGMTNQIITNLAKLKVLSVIGRTSVMHFKRTTKTIPEIAKELNNVSYVLEGSIQKSGNRIKVNAQLIRAEDGFHQWAEVYDRQLSDVFTVQDELSAKIANALLGELGPSEKNLIKTDRPTNVKAYEHYIKAYYIHLNVYGRSFSNKDFLNCEAEFKKAIALDPHYALAFAGLADLYDTKKTFDSKTVEEKLSLEKQFDKYSKEAIKLSPDLPYALGVRGSYYIHRSNPNIDSGYQLQFRSVKLAPNDPKLIGELGLTYSRLGLFPIAINLFDRCIALDPTAPYWEHFLAWAFLNSGDTRNFEIHMLRCESKDPSSELALSSLFWLSLFSHDLSRADELLKKMVMSKPDGDFQFPSACLYAMKGEKEKALNSMVEMNSLVFSLLGMKEDALRQLPKEQWGYLTLKNHPFFENIRNDPRFQKLLEDAKVAYEQRILKYPLKL